MNRKGFTLIELLAVIAILGLISGIATYGVISTINNSRLKSEKIFIDKVSNLIDDYLDLNPPKKKGNTTYTFVKCVNESCSESYSVTATNMFKEDNTSIYLNDLITEGIINSDDLVNPKNKEDCLDGVNPEIYVYKDSDYVYYYYVDLSGSNTSCDITPENGIINTLPDNLKDQVNCQ